MLQSSLELRHVVAKQMFVAVPLVGLLSSWLRQLAEIASTLIPQISCPTCIAAGMILDLRRDVKRSSRP